MFGLNSVKLHLTPSFKILHRVFNLSLISRFVPAIDIAQDTDLPMITSLAADFFWRIFQSLSFSVFAVLHLARMNIYYNTTTPQAWTITGLPFLTYHPLFFFHSLIFIMLSLIPVLSHPPPFFSSLLLTYILYSSCSYPVPIVIFTKLTFF